MKKTLFLILAFLPWLTNAQHFRDNFLGTYYCSVYQWNVPSTYGYISAGTAVVSISNTDTNKIQIQLTDTFYSVDREFVLYSDSSFESVDFSNNWSGRFFDDDSIYVYYNHLSPATDYYYGKKIDVGVNEINFSSIQIYPNPITQNKFFINEAINFREIEIYNVTGNLMLANELKNHDQVEIDVSDFETGIYFVKCSTDKESFVKKIVVQH